MKQRCRFLDENSLCRAPAGPETPVRRCIEVPLSECKYEREK